MTLKDLLRSHDRSETLCLCDTPAGVAPAYEVSSHPADLPSVQASGRVPYSAPHKPAVLELPPNSTTGELRSYHV